MERSQRERRIALVVLGTVASAVAIGAWAGSSRGSHQTLAPSTTSSTVSAPTSSIPTTSSEVAPATMPTTGTTSPGGLSLLVEPTAGPTPIYSFMGSADRAGDSLEMTMYELDDSHAVAILCEDRSSGASVAVLLDSAYDGGTVNQADGAALSACGVSVSWAPKSTIFHQKTITVLTPSSSTSMVMSMNLTAQYYATTRDYIVVDSYLADVQAIVSTFRADTEGVVPTSGAPTGRDLIWSPGSATGLIELIAQSATGSTLLVENEELSAKVVVAALQDAAARGVHVEVCIQKSTSTKTAVAALEGAGVVVHLADLPSLYIHGKAISVNGRLVYVGSINLSDSSLYDNRELGVVTSTAGVVGALTATLQSDFARS